MYEPHLSYKIGLNVIHCAGCNACTLEYVGTLNLSCMQFSSPCIEHAHTKLVVHEPSLTSKQRVALLLHILEIL